MSSTERESDGPCRRGVEAPACGTVGVDTRNLALPRGTGVATYAAMLTRCLPEIGWKAELWSADPPRPRALRWLLATSPFARQAHIDPRHGGQSVADLFRTAHVHFDIWGRLAPIRAVRTPDLMHWTYPLPLRLLGCPNLYTVHDLIPLLQPHLTGIDPGRFARVLARIVRTADRIVTVSESTRQEIITTLRVPPERVVNTWQAVAVGKVAESVPAGLPPQGYWLHVGATERRKNLRRLLDVWRSSGTTLPLVLAGPDGGEALPEDMPGLIRLPWLDRPALLALIRGARALLMPSLAEGFGLPVVEAMALGTPVLTSDTGALAEIAGGAALRIDPVDGHAMTAGLRALDGDAALRDRLQGAGFLRAALFTPEAYARRLAELYRGLRPR